MAEEQRGLDEGKSGRGSPRIVVALAVLSGLALILAGTGIYMGWTANEELASFKKEVNSRPNQVGDLRAEVEFFENRLENVGAVTVRINNNLEALHDQTQRTLSEQARELRSVRQEQSEMTSRLVGLESGAPAALVAVPEAVEGGAPASAPGEVSAPPDGYHLIELGDNYEKLANRYGVTVMDFMNANPGLEPRRLQIGQKVKIPQ